jgi:hypothetical protein
MAMDAELAALKQNATWRPADLPPGRRAIGCRWVFKVKTKNGKFERFKARLVARGFSQLEGIDYTATFSPVAKFDTIRLLLSLVASRGMHAKQMDTPNAYLKSDLREEIYMQKPEGYKNPPGQHGDVLRLLKGLYGLKQSGREWNQELASFMKTLGFQQCRSDTCVFVRRQHGHLSFIIVEGNREGPRRQVSDEDGASQLVLGSSHYGAA